MATVPSHGELISRDGFDRLLTAFLALDRAVMELHMQIYAPPPHQQSAIRKQNRALHGVVRKHLPGMLYGSRVPARRVR